MGRYRDVAPFLRKKLNNRSFTREEVKDLKTECGHQIGFITPKVAPLISNYDSFFTISPHEVLLRGCSFEERTRNMSRFAADVKVNWLALADELNFPTNLLGWRNELYTVYPLNENPLRHNIKLFNIERGLCKFLGIETYGVHVNCFTRKEDGLYIWVGRRSPNKSTFPNMIDQCVAGGMTAGLPLESVLAKEAEEEASIPADLVSGAALTTFVQYCYHMEHFIKREMNFVYDLELPTDFTPATNDGETVEFRQVRLDEQCKLFDRPEEWKPNCFAITLDFAVRHGTLPTQHLQDLCQWNYLTRNTHIFNV